MICEDKVKEYCRQAIMTERYSQFRKCNKCCMDCNDPCSNICKWTLELKNKDFEKELMKLNSVNVAEVIPFRTFKEKIRIVKEELKKDRYVEIWNGYVYSARKL